ncbi:MAG: hypothetical protein GXX90_10865 [Microbacteriaceae bacterium]|nr:hypothetical protein [Microbacteriaceae bacterium]
MLACTARRSPPRCSRCGRRLTWLTWLAVAVAAVALGRVLDPGPPGACFFVLMTGAGTLLAATGSPIPAVLGWIALGSALAMLAGGLDASISARLAARASAAGERDPASAPVPATGAASPAPGVVLPRSTS